MSDGLELAMDSAAGERVTAATTGPWLHVSSLLPTGFAAYARIFDPAWLYHPANVGPPRETVVSWSAIAAHNGRRAHPAMQWPRIIAARPGPGYEQPGLWNVAPSEGSLPRRETLRLLWILDGHTATPYSCWFAVWDGFGTLPPALDQPDLPKLHMPNRDMLLFSGSLHCAAASFAESPLLDHQSPSLWWPADRAWCVATDVDFARSQSAHHGPDVHHGDHSDHGPDVHHGDDRDDDGKRARRCSARRRVVC